MDGTLAGGLEAVLGAAVARLRDDFPLELAILHGRRDRREVVIDVQDELAILERGARRLLVGLEAVVERSLEGSSGTGDIQAEWNDSAIGLDEARVPPAIRWRARGSRVGGQRA